MKLKLEKGDRISFFGCSVTSHGIWIREVVEHFLQKYPELEIGFYNFGISGSKGGCYNLKNRMYCDCLNVFPKYVVVMFGGNDVEMSLHGSENPEDIKKMRESHARYPEALREIIQRCRAIGATPILCSPPPYDEYNDSPTEIKPGTDKDLEKLSGIAKDIAEENGLIFVDMRNAVLAHIDEKPITPDRVHPNEYGYHLMAERFLLAIGEREVEQPDKIVEISEKNMKRYEVEQILRNIMFVERDGMGWQYEDFDRPLEERKKLLTEFNQTQDSEYWDMMERDYLKYADFKDELRGELIKRTLDMYK